MRRPRRRPRDGRRGRRLPLPRRALGARRLRPGRRRPRSATPSIERLVAALVPALLRARRRASSSRPATLTTDAGRGAAWSARRARSSCSSRTSSTRWQARRWRDDRRDVTATPLPARILIPLANPRPPRTWCASAPRCWTRGGVLTALGIVEVPEGDAALRGRHARPPGAAAAPAVLEFAPDGVDLRTVVRIGRRAAEGIVEAGRRGGGRPHHLRLGRHAPPAAATAAARPVFSPTIDEVVRDAPCDIAVVKQRGIGEVRRILVPVRGGPHAELALRFADALGRSTRRRDGRRPARRAAGRRRRRSGPRPSARWRRSSSSTPAGRAEAVLREAPNVAQRHPARGGDAPTSWSWAPRPQPGGARSGDAYLFGALPEAIAARAKPSVIVVKTRERLERATFEQRAARAETLDAAERAAEEARARPGARRALVRRVQLPPRRVRRPAPPRRAQGEAGPDHQPRPADAQRGGHDRRHRARGRAAS